MPYSALENKLKSIPEQYFEQVSSFLNLILSLSNNITSIKTVSARHPIPGLAKGEFKYPDNINLYDDEIADMFGV